MTAAAVLRATHKTKFDNRKKIDFFQNENRFLEKNEINIPSEDVDICALYTRLVVRLFSCDVLFVFCS